MGAQAQWDIRQYPPLHRIWATLWGSGALWVTLDSCRFSPPWRAGYAEPYGLHWDHDPWDDQTRMLQGVLALTDTAADQGGFCCVPSLFQDRSSWPKAPVVDVDGDENWLAEATGRDIAFIPAKAGDLIVWDWRLPHSNSKNLSTRPRLAFYVAMYPNTHVALRNAAVESWRSGRCVPWWRNRRGYDRIEPWPPARLSELGRRLIGLMRGNKRAPCVISGSRLTTRSASRSGSNFYRAQSAVLRSPGSQPLSRSAPKRDLAGGLGTGRVGWMPALQV